MSKRDRIRTQKKYYALIERLGGKCVVCGRTTNLEIDHIRGRTYVPRELSSDHRISLYLKEEKQGLIQVLCETCNVKKQRRLEKEGKPEQEPLPF